MASKIRGGSKERVAGKALAAPPAMWWKIDTPEPWVMAAAWSSTSLGATGLMSIRNCSAMVTRFRWVSIAPLGRPVVPDV